MKGPTPIDWTFPIPSCHHGPLLGNATLGAMIWGDGNLHITLNRADLWDHQGGMPFRPALTHARVSKLLRANQEPALRRLFAASKQEPQRPTRLPLGRLELDFGKNARPVRARLSPATGELTVDITAAGQTHRLRLCVATTSPLLLLKFEEPAPRFRVTARPSWDFLPATLRERGFAPPEHWRRRTCEGWVQSLPKDPAVCVAWHRVGAMMAIAVDRADTPQQAIQNGCARVLDGAFDRHWRESRRWWRTYTQRLPHIQVPSATHRFIHDYGMYKFAGLTHPAGVAATLQGPWVEEHAMPPWAGDYHFNVNVQECYWPAFAADCCEHLHPLFDMIQRWLPILRRNAESFLGIEDGLMLPAAVDDRCTAMGGFWTGVIDHGCTAWIGQLMWDYYRYTQNTDFLADTVFPFMKGAFNTTMRTLQKRGRIYRMPISVSPEYNGCRMNAWGANASFQLAWCHFLANALQKAARILRQKPDPQWREIAEKLPLATLRGNAKQARIILWEGQDLEDSHRHHSHLAGIYPADTLPFEKEPWRSIVTRSITHWTSKGMGQWTGWCMPWASILHSRLGNADMAALMLDLWEQVFTNTGHGTLHDAAFKGFTHMAARPEMMQIEAGMGAAAAVQEMLLHSVKDEIRVLPAVPDAWPDAGFSGMLAPGNFVVDAERNGGNTTRIRIASRSGGHLKLRHGMGDKVALNRNGRTTHLKGPVLQLNTARDDIIEITRR